MAYIRQSRVACRCDAKKTPDVLAFYSARVGGRGRSIPVQSSPRLAATFLVTDSLERRDSRRRCLLSVCFWLAEILGEAGG